MTNGNGQAIADLQKAAGLPPTREAVVEQGLRIQQETAAERDELRRMLAQRDSDIAAYKVAVEAMSAQLAQADSRVEAATLTRDDAVRRAAEVETVLASMLALGRAFSIKHQPHITGDGDHADLVQRPDAAEYRPNIRDIG
jgi:hypothetical protein